MKQKKPLEILSLVSAFGSVLCTPWFLHGAVKQLLNGSNSKPFKSVDNKDYDVDVGISSASECEPLNDEAIADGPD